MCMILPLSDCWCLVGDFPLEGRGASRISRCMEEVLELKEGVSLLIALLKGEIHLSSR